MFYPYLVTPFVAWFVAGSLKFVINSLIARKAATQLIGYGGFPSNHSTIVCSMATLIGLREGFDNAAFGVAVTLAFVVMLDAASLRRHVGKHASTLNQLTRNDGGTGARLRERIGHTPVEVIAGTVVGAFVAVVVNQYFS